MSAALLVVLLDDPREAWKGVVQARVETPAEYFALADRDGAMDPRLRLWEDGSGRIPVGARVRLGGEMVKPCTS